MSVTERLSELGRKSGLRSPVAARMRKLSAPRAEAGQQPTSLAQALERWT